MRAPQDYTEGAYESTDPGYFRLTGEAPPDSLREYLDHLHWRMKRVRWDNITEEDIRFEFIRNEEIVDYEAKWFADNTKMLVSYVESEEVEEATLASIAETLEAAEAADEATPVTATAEEKENFKRWITFHNRCEEAEEERRKEIVATESVAQGARSAQAALVDAERLRYMQGDLLPDGSPNVDFLERAAQAKKSRGTTKRQVSPRSRCPDPLQSQLSSLKSQSSLTPPPRTPSLTATTITSKPRTTRCSSGSSRRCSRGKRPRTRTSSRRPTSTGSRRGATGTAPRSTRPPCLGRTSASSTPTGSS